MSRQIQHFVLIFPLLLLLLLQSACGVKGELFLPEKNLQTEQPANDTATEQKK